MFRKHKPVQNYELSAISQETFDDLVSGDLHRGAKFKLGDVDAVCMTISDDDKHLNTRRKYFHDDNNQTADIQGLGAVGEVDAGTLIRLRSSTGEKFKMIELVTETGGTYWTFVGGVPDADEQLTIQKIYNDKKVHYSDGLGVKFINAADDTLTTDEDTATTGNLLDNDCVGVSVSHDDDDDDDGGIDGSDFRIVAVEDGEVGDAFTVVSARGHEALVTVAEDGTITVDPSGGFDSLAAGETDTVTLSYTVGAPRIVSKGKKACTVIETDKGEVTVLIAGVNDAPVARADTFSVLEDIGLTTTALTGLLANDFDVDGDSLTASLVSGPENGTLTLNSDGSFHYAGNADFNGQDSFTYRVSDPSGASATATAVIDVVPVNDAPIAVADSYDAPGQIVVGASEGVLANDTDVDGDVLTASLEAGPANGALILNPDGSFSYQPTSLFSGEAAFTYRATDPSGASSTATATITVPERAQPQAESYSIDEDSPLIVGAAAGVLANDPLAAGDTLTATLLADPDHGELVLEQDGSFTYMPDADFNGSDAFLYRVTDSAGETIDSVAEITVDPVNDAPLYDLSSFRQLAVAGEFSIGKVIASVAASDVDGDARIFRLEGADAFLFDLVDIVESPTTSEVQLIGRGTFENGDPLFPNGSESVLELAGPDLEFHVTLFVSDGIEETSVDITLNAISAA